MAQTLRGRRVLVTRERPGELGAALTARGAEVVHLPLIAVVEPIDSGAQLGAALDRLDEFDWLVVTSPAGAERVGPAAASARVHLAAVGTATAATLARESRRDIDLVPTVQRADRLAEEFIAATDVPQRVLLAQADRARPDLSSALRAAGHDVVEVIAYRTIDVEPTPAALEAIDSADAVVFASGSAVESWCRSVGDRLPPIVAVIGPATAEVAQRRGVAVSGVASDHSIEGLVDELERLVVRLT